MLLLAELDKFVSFQMARVVVAFIKMRMLMETQLTCTLIALLWVISHWIVRCIYPYFVIFLKPGNKGHNLKIAEYQYFQILSFTANIIRDNLITVIQILIISKTFFLPFWVNLCLTTEDNIEMAEVMRLLPLPPTCNILMMMLSSL